MGEPGGQLDLAEEPVGADLGGDLRPQDLEGDAPVVPQVLGEEDDGHAPLAELALDRVTTRQAVVQALFQVTHGR